MDYLNTTKEELIDELGEIKRKYESLLSIVKSDHSEDNSSEIGRWKHAIEHTTDGLWDWDLVTNKVFFSKQWKAMLGFEEDEIGDSLEEWSKRVLPEDLEETIGKVEKHIKGETDFYESEHRLICKSGEVKWILDRGKVIDWENGIPTRMIGTHTDINQQKRKELDLIERQKELNCHNQITDIMSNPKASIDETFKKIVQSIPPAWQFPGFTFASITIYDQSFNSDRFEETPNCLEQQIIVNQDIVGFIYVYCQTVGLPYHEQIFLPEEKELLISIAERLGNFLEKKQKEEDLNASEIKYKSLIEQISDVIYNVDEDGVIKYISPAIEKVMGYSPQEILGKNFLTFAGENTQMMSLQMEDLSNGREVSNEYRLFTKSGSECWARLSTKPIIKEGKFSGGTGTLIDITSIKLAQQSLIKSEETYRRLTETINDVIYEISLEGIIKYVSPSFEKITGYTPQEVIGTNVFQIIFPEDKIALKQRLSFDEIPDPPYFDLRFVAKDGTTRWARSFPSIVYENGAVVGRTGILTDITTQKKVEIELKESEELYRSIIQTSPDSITITDLSGIIVFTSPKSYEIFGFNSSVDYLGHLVSEFISPVDKERAIKNFERIVKEKIGTNEYKATRKDGSEIFIEVSSDLILDADGCPSKILLTIRDISDKKLVEEKIRQNEIKFRNLIETISDVIYEVDLYGNLLYVSPSSERVLGYKVEEVLGTNIFKYIYPEDHAFVKNSLASLESRKGRYIEYRYVTKQGEVRWVRSATSPKYADGVWAGGIGSLTDITDKKKSELELLKLSRAVEQSPVSIVITNLEGNIEYANPKACETTGYDLCELIGQNPRVLKSGETPSQEYEYLWDSISHGNIWGGIFHNKRKNGELYWESSQITPIINSDKQVTHYLAIKEDITEKKSVQEALLKTELRFSRIAELNQTVIWETNSEGIYTYLSPAVKTVWGYEPEELIEQKHFWDIHPEEGKKDFIDACYRDISNLQPFRNMESPIIRKDGKIGVMLTNGMPVTDQDGNLLGYCGSSNDITEQKNILQALQDSELRYRSIFRDSKSVMLVLNPETGFIIDANLSAVSFYGWSRNELCNKKINEINTLAPAQVKSAMARTNRQEQQHHFFKHRLANGQIRDVEVFSGPTKFGDKNYLFSIIHDITERRIAEEALLQRENDLTHAQEIANMGSWMLDLITNKLSWSDNLYRLFDLDLEKTNLTLNVYFNLIHPDDRHLIDEGMETMLRTKQHMKLEIRMNLNSGRTIWVENTIIPYFDNGHLVVLKGSTVDITEKKKAEDFLRKSEEELNQAQEMAGMASWQLDLRNNKLAWSKNYYQLMNIPVGTEMKTEFFIERVHPDDLHLVDEYFDKIIRTKKPVTYDIRILIPNGEYKWVQNNIAPEYENGELMSLKGVNIDINEKKQTEEKIKYQNKRLNAIIEAIPDLVFVIDKNGYYLEVFASQQEKLLIQPERIIGSNLEQAFDKQMADMFLEKIHEAIEKRTTVVIDYVISLANSTSTDFEARIVPIDDEKVLILSRDVTEKSQREKELKRLSMAVQQSPVITVVTDLKANIEYANPAFEQITGYQLNEVIGKNVRILQSGKTDQKIYKNLWETITRGKIWRGEWIDKKKSGELYWEDVLIAPIYGVAGKITNYLAIKMDITQRKQAEQEILELNANLELKIKERTQELAIANSNLLNEIEIRSLAEDALLASEEKYRSVVENVKEVIFLTDADGFWMFLNKAWEEVTGFSVQESIGKLFVNYVHPEDRERNWKLFEPLIQRKKEYCRHEIRYLTKDGGFRWIEVFARLGLNDQGEITGTYGTLRDITEWKQLSEFENELLQLSPKLSGVSLPEIESAINLALSRIGTVLNADRSYIFEFKDEMRFMNNTYEWCNQEIAPQINELQNVPVEIFPEWMEKMHQFENIIIESVEELPESWNAEKEILQAQGIQSVLVIPLLGESSLIGFVGLDSVKSKKIYTPTEINILKVWSNMLSSLISNKRTSQLIEQTRQNYHTFFNTIDDFLIILDFYGKIVHANKTVSQRLGYTADELMNKPILMLRPQERKQEAINTFMQVMKGVTDFCAIPFVTKSGVQIPVETHIKRGQWDGEERFFMVSKDISQIKLSEEKFSAAFKVSSAMMAIIDIRDEKLIDINDAFKNQLGYNRDEVLGKTSVDIDLFADIDAHSRIIKNINQHYEVKELEIDVKTKSKAIRTVLLSAIPLFVGDQRCVLKVMVDITERKKAEDEIRKARMEAEKANRAKSEFLSRMSHELRTPMNSILGFAQIMEMTDLNSGQKKGVAHILKSGKHLLDLINEVLDISRIEAGRISLSLEPIGLESIVLETLDVVKTQANSRQINVELLDSSTNQLFVKADRQRLKQVLINLLNNAIKYNKEGGSVRVYCEFGSKNQIGKSMIRISISDTGNGISEDDLPKLFMPFERIGADKTTTEGTGLGLSVVKKLIEIMDGNLGVESLPNVGSTFWIELPQTENQIQKAINDEGLDMHDGSLDEKVGTILYIEDNISNIELVEQILSIHQTNIRLETTMYGSEAVSMSLKCEPDLILLDLNLPDMHGSNVLKLLQENDQTRDVPVVVISADAMPKQLQQMLEAGAKDYLTKPLDVKEFIRIIDKFL